MRLVASSYLYIYICMLLYIIYIYIQYVYIYIIYIYISFPIVTKLNFSSFFFYTLADFKNYKTEMKHWCFLHCLSSFGTWVPTVFKQSALRQPCSTLSTSNLTESCMFCGWSHLWCCGVPGGVCKALWEISASSASCRRKSSGVFGQACARSWNHKGAGEFLWASAACHHGCRDRLYLMRLKYEHE